MFLKGMAESSLLSKDERLTPDIDKVMTVDISYEIPPHSHSLYDFFEESCQFSSDVVVL